MIQALLQKDQTWAVNCSKLQLQLSDGALLAAWRSSRKLKLYGILVSSFFFSRMD